MLLRLCDALVTDHSVASATGLLDLATLEWDPRRSTWPGIAPEQLPELVPPPRCCPG